MMIREARGVLKLNPDPGYRVALNHLEEFSHVWLVFVFHHVSADDWRPTIRPPRVGSYRKVGLFASRSPHRPNPIGISAVKLERIDLDAPGGIEIHLSGVDLMDGTPVIDLKPYVPYADSLPDANGGWAEGEIPRYKVEFSPESLAVIERSEQPRLLSLITQMLEWDPRPTSQRRGMPIEDDASQGMKFGFRVMSYDVKWEIRDRAIYVRELVAVSTHPTDS
jgi:tRNA-Thr(GGU) m(6)t(6)A37 methyltransferase TsaA